MTRKTRRNKRARPLPVKHTLSYQDMVYGDYVAPPQASPARKFFIAALVCSVIFHVLFVYISQIVQVASVKEMEEKVETLFRVQFRELESLNFVSRPTQQQLRDERERVLQEELTDISTQASRSVDETIQTTLPSLSGASLPMPSTVGDEEDNFFVDDQSARSVITSDVGNRSVREFEGSAGGGAVDDSVETNRVALTGRGGSSTQRLVEDMPEPDLTREPVETRSITMSLITDLAPPVPEMDVDEPPIELPPDTEILPSPDILPDTPVSAPLKDEQVAIEEIKNRFVQLDDLLDVELFTYHHVGGDGYFMVRIRPNAADERLRVLPKDVIFVLDASASMGRLTIEVVKDEIVRSIERLRPEDRFNVIGFNQRVRRFTQTFADVTPASVKAGRSFIRPLEASGMTDIYSSLHPLVQLGTERARPLIVLLFSDGRPNVGVVNSRKIINDLTRFQGPSTSIYSIGTGDEMNRYLLDMLAFRNRGRVWFGEGRDSLPGLIQSVYQYIDNPVLLRIKAGFGSIDEAEVYPKSLPDLYLQGEIRLWGKLKGEKNIPLRLVGEAYDEQKEIVVNLPVPELDNGTYEIARDWARSKIYNISGRMVYEGENEELLREIEFLSRTYRVDTPYSQIGK